MLLAAGKGRARCSRGRDNRRALLVSCQRHQRRHPRMAITPCAPASAAAGRTAGPALSAGGRAGSGRPGGTSTPPAACNRTGTGRWTRVTRTGVGIQHHGWSGCRTAVLQAGGAPDWGGQPDLAVRCLLVHHKGAPVPAQADGEHALLESREPGKRYGVRGAEAPQKLVSRRGQGTCRQRHVCAVHVPRLHILLPGRNTWRQEDDG